MMFVTYTIKFNPKDDAATAPTSAHTADSDELKYYQHSQTSESTAESQILSDSSAYNTPTKPPMSLFDSNEISDIEELSAEIDSMDQRSSLPPLERFRKKNKISVTDLSAQLWCEKQLEFVLTTGRKRETAAMREGTARHELLEQADHEVVEVTVETREDNLGLRLLNSVTLLHQLLEKGRSREIWVFSVLSGVLIRGVIDEVELRDNKRTGRSEVCLSDTKTRRKCEEPSAAQKRTSAIQLQVYCHIVNEMRRGETDYASLVEYYEVDETKRFEAKELLESGYTNIQQLIRAFRDIVENRLPPVRCEMDVVYEFGGHEFARNRVPYNAMTTLYTVEELLDWWRGTRTADGVLQCESWKCKHCDFLADCTITPLRPPEIMQALKEQEKREIEAEVEAVLKHAELTPMDMDGSETGS